jgi:hypothetical protein
MTLLIFLWLFPENYCLKTDLPLNNWKKYLVWSELNTALQISQAANNGTVWVRLKIVLQSLIDIKYN